MPKKFTSTIQKVKQDDKFLNNNITIHFIPKYFLNNFIIYNIYTFNKEILKFTSLT